MAKFFDALDDNHTRFIAAQHIFFVATAAATGTVNLSPKGMDALRTLGPNRLIWRNLTGSGNETAGHLGQLNRMTLMWCSFDARPLILRVYGSARIVLPGAPDWEALNAPFPPDPGARQIFDMTVDKVQTSCGYSIPLMEFTSDRDVLAKWSQSKGEDGIRTHWQTRNQSTIDGFPSPTGQ